MLGVFVVVVIVVFVAKVIISRRNRASSESTTVELGGGYLDPMVLGHHVEPCVLLKSESAVSEW